MKRRSMTMPAVSNAEAEEKEGKNNCEAIHDGPLSEDIKAESQLASSQMAGEDGEAVAETALAESEAVPSSPKLTAANKQARAAVESPLCETVVTSVSVTRAPVLQAAVAPVKTDGESNAVTDASAGLAKV